MLPIRKGYEPPDTSTVARGGLMLDSDIRKSAVKCLTQHRVLGITVYVADVPDLADLVSRVPQLIPYRQLSVCALRDLAGYELIPSGPAPHYTLVIPSVEPADIAKLKATFEIVKNPLVEADK